MFNTMKTLNTKKELLYFVITYAIKRKLKKLVAGCDWGSATKLTVVTNDARN